MKSLIYIIAILSLVSCTRPNTRTYENQNSSGGTVEIIYTTESGSNDNQSTNSGTLTVQDENGQITEFQESINNNPDIVNCSWSLDGQSNFV